MSHEASTHVCNAIEDFLVEDEWEFEKSQVDETLIFSTRTRGEHSEYVVHLGAFGVLRLCWITVGYSSTVPGHRLAEVQALCSMVNDRELTGALVTSPEGMVKFRLGVFLAGNGDGFDPTLVGRGLHYAAWRADMFFPSVMAVAHGGQAPREAMAHIYGIDDL